jgi:hypothetical protein
LLIEYKWYKSGNIPKDLFLDEFVNRDLNNITNLKNLQWRIKGLKLTKEKVMEYLSSPEGREMLKNSKIIQMFDNYAENVNYSENINNVNDLIGFLQTDSSWYSLIFK